MPIIRNPFARRPAAATAETSRPGSSAATTTTEANPGFERVDTVGSMTSSALSIRSGKSQQDNGEYKMSGKPLLPRLGCHETICPVELAD